ncbi:hypothetical protein DNX69_06160 [Rhodopseudomonas palustris]|uniref:Uncharacterized protein n=1 Tax=Rhodopseudomonas palustris TaxID=1076 RepID=A0A323UYI0_RHOPL|nr:hypothetical protein DNX69_06160 [Rhodopseudomonas palustris]
MARIELKVDRGNGLWYLVWAETEQVVGHLSEESPGRFRILPDGPYWSPMKSFGGQLFDTPEAALEEVRVYFRRR